MGKSPVKGRVILTYGRSIIALAIAHSLGKRGVEVIGGDDVELTVLQFSKYVQDTFLYRPWQEDPEGFIDDLIEHIKEHRPTDGVPYVLIPSFRDATTIARHRERLEKHIIVAAPSVESIDAVLSKAAFARTAASNDLPIPQTLTAESLDDLQTAENFPEPAIVKPPDSHGGRGIRLCQNRSEALAYCQEIVDSGGELPVIQSVAPGEDFCFAALCDHGEIVAHMAYRNLQQYPIEAGQGVVRKTVSDKAFLPSATKLLRVVNWHGVAQIDYRWDEQGDPVMIEVNPRFWAGLVHSMESGIDFPWLLYQISLSEPIEPSEAVIDFTTNTPGLSWLSALQESIDSNETFEELGQHWDAFKDQLEGHKWEKAWRSFANLMTTEIHTEPTMEKWRALNELSRNAHSDLLLDEDPQAALGMLFVVSSLVRHGELPPEFKS
ncbi:ATP-grasp domain-containing protein [Cerasicoccus arenae]|nr:ATP-grasp domain-containing protein [Cerasicoccus arenae]MBK1858447.1 ATP-grasp domain-containing protein [Cerasicoccus arenae]